MTEQPPADPLGRSLWAMGHNAEQRKAIIDYAAKMGTDELECDPLAIGRMLMPQGVAHLEDLVRRMRCLEN